MLPDFPEQKKHLHQFFMDRIAKKQKSDIGVFRDVPMMVHHEGNSWALKRSDGSEDRSPYESITSTFEVRFDEVTNLTADEILARLDSVATELSNQFQKHAIEKIMTGAEESGQVVHAHSQGLTEDDLLEVFRKIEIDFDKNGNPRLPSLMVYPNTWHRIGDRVQEIGESSSYRQRFNELVDEKRREWRDRESNRKLVD